MARRWVGFGATLVLLVLAACGQQRVADLPSILGVAIDQANPQVLRVGASLPLSATVAASGGADPSVAWSSSQPGIAYVASGTGVLVGVAEGSVTVTATSRFDASVSDSITAFVSPVPSVSDVSIDPSGPHALAVGGSLSLSATVAAVGGAEEAVTWASSDAGVAMVDVSGRVTAIAAGSTTITASSTFDASVSDSVTVLVTASAAVTSLRIDQGDIDLIVGDAQVLTASVVATGGASRDVSWGSDDSGVATVDASGRVTAIAAGSASITASSDFDASVSDSVTVRVFDAPDATDFDIEIVYFDESFSAAQKAAFDAAVNVWRDVIVGDVVEASVARAANGSCGQGEPAIDRNVDDLVIFATSFTDAVGGLLGSAGPCLVRFGASDQGIPIVGFMRFDTMDLDNLLASGDLVETIAHEMGHVLGLGTIWEAPWLGFDFLDYVPSGAASDCRTATGFTVRPTYNGSNGVDAWQASLTGSGQPLVEDEFGPGTQCGHWNDYTFGNELMTGFLNSGSANPLSILTVRSLEDIGYTVDPSSADAYALPGSPGVGTQSASGYDLSAAEILLTPLGGVDPESGRETDFR